MASVAGDTSGVICGYHLGEVLRFGAVGLVTAGAQDGRVELRRRNGRGVVGMFGQGTVASLASDYDMLASLFLIHNVGMAGFACVMAGKGNWPGCDLRDGRSAIVPILPEAARNNGSAQHDERNYCDCHYHRKSNEVLDVPKQVCFPLRDCWLGPGTKLGDVLRYL